MKIKKILKSKGYTIEQVAKEMGISRVTLTNSINGNPTVATLQKIADVVGCSVGDFFEHTVTCPYCGKSLSVSVGELD